MHVVVIGGTGHIGTYLIPRLIEGGATVTVVSRQQREPYQPHAAWKQVKHLLLDREKLEHDHTFGTTIRALNPDVVIDLICFTPKSNQQLVDALRGQIQHFLHCGTIWVHGHGTQVPTTEDAPRHPFGEYGLNKAAIENDLLNEARNPAGHFNPSVFTTLAKAEPLALPHFGLETVHHVHADDVAQMFIRAMTHWNAAVGESFHTVSPAAVTLRGYAEAMAAWFGQPANLSFLPFEQWKATVSAEEATATWEHIARSPSSSIEKARRRLGYAPRYTSLEAVQESVSWLIEQGKISI
jgi:nucleoside-diphosphate-sugar epimerase